MRALCSKQRLVLLAVGSAVALSAALIGVRLAPPSAPIVAQTERAAAPAPRLPSTGTNREVAETTPLEPRSADTRETTRASEPDVKTAPRWLRDALGLDDSDPSVARVVTNRSATGGNAFDARDLAALQDLIDANGLSESSSPFDFDNDDGTFEPWELGFQAWQGGRLVALAFGPDPFSSFGYRIERLSGSIGALSALRALDAHGVGLEELPPEIGQLSELHELRLFRNQLEELPSSIGDLTALETIALNDNELQWLPESMQELTGLQHVYLGDNPLDELPLFLMTLPITHLDIRNLPGSARAQENLVTILDTIPIEELHATPEDVASVSPALLARIPRIYGVPGHGGSYAARSAVATRDTH